MRASPPLTKSAFARLMEVREATVRGWVADGMPVRADGKVNEAAARRWVKTYLDGARRQARMEGTSGGTVSDLRAHKLVEHTAIERAAETVGYILKQMSPQAW